MKKVVVGCVMLIGVFINLNAMDYLPRFLKKHPKQEQVQTITPHIAVIYLSQEINPYKMMLNIVDAVKNKEIMGILLVIDNNGGPSSIYSSLHDLVKKATETKPVVGLIVGSALSGGYYVACATNYLIAHSFANIGNIGVVSEISRYKDTKITGPMEALVEVEVLYEGEFKVVGHPHKDLTTKERAHIQEGLAIAYNHFVDVVAQCRHLDKSHSKEWAQGRILYSPQALELDLIDEIGTWLHAEQVMLGLISKKNPDSVFEQTIVPVFYEE